MIANMKKETETQDPEYKKELKSGAYLSPSYSKFPPSQASLARKATEDESEGDVKEDFTEEEESSYRLKTKQKLQVMGIILSSFLLFGFFLFPYQTLARYFFFNFANRISLGIGNVELNFLSSSFIEEISFSFGKGGGVRAQQLRLDAPLLGLIGNSLDGSMELKKAYYASEALSLSASEAVIFFNIEDRSVPPSEWQGSIDLKTKNFKLLGLNIPQLDALGVDLSRMKVQKFQLKFNFEQGKVSFDGSQLLSNTFSLKLKGSSQLSSDIGASRLHAELCIIPSPELEKLDSNLMGIYILAGGTAGAKLCIKVRGQLLKPDFERKAGLRSPRLQEKPSIGGEASAPPLTPKPPPPLGRPE